ncbi:MAG: LysR family transcriptional regulator [Brumimicrobium sp.]|nr:LysR family transcriptional regulator [Brumimicrobium sp.]
MISPIQIEYILALLKHQNFQRAADACHVTQPTLSMQLKKAEDDVGYKIIDRDSQPIKLTKAGEMLLPFLLDINESYRDMDVQIQKLKGVYKSEIRIGIIPTIANYLVPELYSKWQSKLGDVHLDITELTTANLLDAIREKAIDFGIMAGPLNDPSLDQQILYNEDILVYAPGIQGSTISLSQLENKHPWLLSPGNCLRTQMINFCQLKEKQTISWNYEGGNLTLLVNMVEQEGGYTLIPSNYVPLLNIDKKHLKRVEIHEPFRQIIGVFMKRNTKRDEFTKIIRSIQHNKNLDYQPNKNSELLPWIS